MILLLTRCAVYNLNNNAMSTFAIGENANGAAGKIKPVAGFSSPVDAVTGEFDFQVCDKSCLTPENQAAAAVAREFPNSGRGSQSFVVPGTSHNINGHFGAPQAFDHSIGFMRANGF